MASPFYNRQKQGLLNNTLILDAFIFADDETTLVPQISLIGVTFTVMKPTDPAGSPSLNGVAGTIVGDGHGQYKVATGINSVVGHYRAIATFSYTDGAISGLTKSIPCSYEIEDPFATTGSSPADPYVDQAWSKLEDCFDSEQGGPWLKDMTMAIFDKYKLRSLLPEVLLAINTQEMPFSSYNEAGFPYGVNDGGALLAQGLLVAGIRHLIRSYTEQADIVNSPVAWESRLKYQQAWGITYQIELDRFNTWLRRWKLRDYDITHGSLLVSSKSGRFMAGPWRSRGIVRGW